MRAGSGLRSRRRCGGRSRARLQLGRIRDRIGAAEQNSLHVRTQLLRYHQRAKSHSHAIFDLGIARNSKRTLTRMLQRDPQILRAIEQHRKPRLDDSRRIAAVRRKTQRQRFVVLRVAERMKRVLDFSACRLGAILGPGRCIRRKNELMRDERQCSQQDQRQATSNQAAFSSPES